MRSRTTFAALFGLALSLGAAGAAQAQFEKMLPRIPHEANALILVNGDKIFSSPLAQKENWQANRQRMFDAGIAFLPPNAHSGVLAAHLDFEFMVPMWELSMFKLNRTVTPDEILAKVGGTMSKIGETVAIDAPGDSYVVQIEPDLVGTILPGNRQLIARWVREYVNKAGAPLGAYLDEAYHFAQDNGTPVILALDLNDLVTEDSAQAAIEKSELLKKDPTADINAMAKVLASMKGVMLGMTFRDRVYGKIKVDFEQDAAPLGKYGKAFLLHALAKHGAMIDEFAKWTPAVNGKQFTLEGEMTESGLQRLSVLFHQPMQVAPVTKSTPRTPSKDEQESIVREATITHYRGVSKLLKDLKTDTYDLKTYGQTALWMDRYAGRIEQLPVVNVDPEMLQYTTYAAGLLRQGSSTLRRGLNQASTAAKSVPTQYNTYSYGETWGYSYRGGLLAGGYMPYGNYGTFNVPDMYATWSLQSKVRSTTEAQAGMGTREVMQELNKAMGEARQKMSIKYMTEF